jgi:hypothetical protein
MNRFVSKGEGYPSQSPLRVDPLGQFFAALLFFSGNQKDLSLSRLYKP